jgi:ankyrin repeat protein
VASAQSRVGACNASSLAEGVAQMIDASISADVRADGCVDELYPTEHAAARTPREQFFRDVESGCLPKVEQALRNGADANARDDGGTPVLARAVAAGQRDVVRALLRAGAGPNATDAAGGTALLSILSRPQAYRAEDLPGILTKQLEILDDLLAAGADLEASNQSGRTVLLEVARMNYDDGSPAVLLRGLIERGANVSARDGEARTAVMLAVLNTHPKVSLQTLQILLAAGSDVNARDSSGKTALRYALEKADAYGRREWGQCLSTLTSAGATAEVSEHTGALKSQQ